MKRSPLQRRTPLARGSAQLRNSPMKRSRMKRRPRKARPGKDDKAYVAWVKQQPCCAANAAQRCWRTVDPHHKTGAGMGARAHDHETMPLCRLHHDQLDDFKGPFLGWTRAQRMEWQEAQIALHRMRYADHLAASAAATAEAVF